MQMGTGAGKTVCAGDISHRIFAQIQARYQVNRIHEHVLYLVHRRELLDQTSRTLEEFGLGGQIGHIMAGRTPKPWCPLQIASVQTLAKRIHKLPWLRPLMLIIDECHHTRAKTWENIVSSFPHARILGMTATPARLDGKGLGTLFDHLVEGPPVKTLIAEGALCDLELYGIKTGVDLKGVHRRMGEFNQTELDSAVTGPVVAATISNWQRLAADRRTIHYSVSRRHSREIVEQARAVGVAAEHVDGDTPKPEREAIFDRFASGVTQFVSNVDLITEGFDAPECDCVIIKPTYSLTLFLQMIGRVMRPKHDGRAGLVLDVGGNIGERHGDPREPYHWTLESGAEIEEFRKKRKAVRVCENCNFVFSARRDECPLCGWEVKRKTASEVDVDLVALSDTQIRKTREKKKRKLAGRKLNAMIMETGGDIGKLIALAKEYGYPGNVPYYWKQKFEKYWNFNAKAR